MRTSNFTRRIRGAAAAALVLGTLTAAHAGSIDPAQDIAGKSQLQLSEAWWQHILSLPANRNPLADTTGARAHVDNNGPVFFLAGSNAAGTTTRTFDVRAGRPIFFPVINGFDVENNTTACDLTCAFAFLDQLEVANATDLHATLDGVDLLTYASYRQRSTGFFKVDWPANDVYGFGLPAGTYDVVSDGYWVGLDGLSPGEHTLVFGGTLPSFGGFTLEVVNHINAVPEPSVLSLLGGLGLVVLMRRRRTA